jgi:GNAT superfamily N-acetyltransferase
MRPGRIGGGDSLWSLRFPEVWILNFEVSLEFPLVRRATPEDSDIIASHRARMFQDMGLLPVELFDEFRVKCRNDIRAAIESGKYIGWLVPDPKDPTRIAAGAGVIVRKIPPIPIPGAGDKTKIYDGRQAPIVNVFTEPTWRRRGLARQLMETIIAWCRDDGIDSVVLHASDDGKELYEKLGFSGTSEMRLRNFGI